MTEMDHSKRVGVKSIQFKKNHFLNPDLCCIKLCRKVFGPAKEDRFPTPYSIKIRLLAENRVDRFFNQARYESAHDPIRGFPALVYPSVHGQYRDLW